jgi:acetylornithine deacetylase/succinyl-diaminopimelate desuccinylase-like protein
VAARSTLSPHDPVADEDRLIGRTCDPFSPQEDAFIELFKETVKENSGHLVEGRDYRIFEDAIGNAYAELLGTDPLLPAGMTGSHGDAVPNGGKYDGVVGVAIGLQTWHTIAHGPMRPKRTFRLAAFRGEESNKTGFACIGSHYATGLITKEQLEKVRARPGVLLKDHFGPTRWALILDGLKHPTITPQNTEWAFEAHIEQSHFIAAYGRDLGVVGRIGGAWREEVRGEVAHQNIETTSGAYQLCRMTFTGVPAHTGAMPPNPELSGGTLHRIDALVASSRVLNELFAWSGDGIYLLKSTPTGDDTGYTLVPHGQVAEVLVSAAKRDFFETSVRDAQRAIKALFGVEMTFTIEPYRERSVRVVERWCVRQLIPIPEIISTLATLMYRHERRRAELGKTRVTATDFRLTPDALVFKIDGREADPEAGKRLREAVRGKLRRLSSDTLVVTPVSESASWPMDPAFTDRLRQRVATTTGWGRTLTWFDMDSHPGHDLKQIRAAGVVQTAMLFGRQEPNPHGISHSPAETFELKDYLALARVAVPFMLQELSR